MFSSCVLSKLLLFILSYYPCLADINVQKQTSFTKWAHDVEKQLHNLVLNVTEENTVKQVYADLSEVDISEVNGMKLVDSIADNINFILKKKEEALQRLVKAAETAANNHEEDLSLTLQRVPFFNVKSDDAAYYLEFNDDFGQNVSLVQSGVHIPLEIYEGYPEILNGLKWSMVLDEVFERNFREDPTLRWQYFGSSRGFMRIFPALKWPESLNPADLYDIRRTAWYMHSIASPKDIIILFDKSGSVHGQTIDIMKIAVKALIRTLSEDDYVNVAWFNNAVDWVVPCLENLMPATSQTKRVLLDAVDRLQESNLTSYVTALEFAFNAFERIYTSVVRLGEDQGKQKFGVSEMLLVVKHLGFLNIRILKSFYAGSRTVPNLQVKYIKILEMVFEETREPWEGANCSKAIMFFSDGGTDWPEELSKRVCNDSTSDCTRIFTFGCGPHPIPTVVLKSMACRTRGFFSSITAIGAIQNRIQDYVRILSRPLVLSGQSTLDLFHWTNVYIDKGGLGPVVTVTLPVAETSPNLWDPQLVGVMGTDIPTELLAAQFPRSQLGSLGYAFAVNKNGFVTFHPQLHRHISFHQGDDPPTVDLLEAEGSFSDGILSLRKSLVDKERGKVKLTPLIIPITNGRAIILPQHYYYAPLETSPFRICVVLPIGHAVVEAKTSLDKETFVNLLNITGSIIAPFPFCGGPHLKRTNTPESLLKLIADDKCNKDLLRHILWDAKQLRKIVNAWTQNPALPESVVFRFVAGEGGLSVVNPPSEAHQFTGENDLHESSYYKRALARRGCILTPEFSHAGGVSSVVVSCSIGAFKGGRYAPVAVVGAAVEQPMIQDVFRRYAGSSCFGEDANHQCYLIDDNGFVVATSRPDVEPGSFLGEVDPQITDDLLLSGLYRLQDRYNFQGYCVRGATEATQASNALRPTIYPLISQFWSNFIQILSNLKFLLFSYLAMQSPIPSEAFFGWELIRSNYSCITKTSWIVAVPPADGAEPAAVAGQHMNRVLQCGECVREMHVAQLPLLAATLIAVEMPCDCAVSPAPMFINPQEDVGPDYCQTPRLPRKPNEKCFSFSKQERNGSCYVGDKSGATRLPHTAQILPAHVFLVCLWFSFR